MEGYGRGGGIRTPDPLLPKRPIRNYCHLPWSATLYHMLLVLKALWSFNELGLYLGLPCSDQESGYRIGYSARIVRFTMASRIDAVGKGLRGSGTSFQRLTLRQQAQGPSQPRVLHSRKREN
jgi:hypothetical protein